MADPAQVTVHRHILRPHDAMLAIGDFGELFEDYHRHTRRWDLPLDPLGTVMMHQALAGAALQLSFRVLDETSAWTVNFTEPPLNLFVVGGGMQNSLTGRYFVEDVETSEQSRLFVQRSHPKRPTQRTALAVKGLDVLDVFEQYFERSEQLSARLLELSTTEMAMVQALPGADPEWLSGLDGGAVRELLDGSTEVIDGRTFTFTCGCDGQRIARALAQMFGDRPEEIFLGDPGIEVKCPRCGARWWVEREDFDRENA